MLDDFREEADSFDFLEEEKEEEAPVSSYRKTSPAPQKRFLGMTPIQRFVIAVLLMLMLIIMGTFFLLITEKIVPTFL
jgi:hypothetical protein